jgi:hypothetical protein
MKTQDKYQFDSTLIGLNTVYHPIGNDGHYINSSNIITKYRIVQTGMTYLFAILTDTPDINLFLVKLLDVHFDSGIVHLKLMGLLTCKTFEVCQIVRGEGNCKWKIYDIEEIQKLIKNKLLKLEDD